MAGETFEQPLNDDDVAYLRLAVDLAREALDAGDEPFGSVLVDADGHVRLKERNRARTVDPTRHPEFEIARWAGANMSIDERRTSVVYTSTEHCPMCSAAHARVGLGRIVYATSAEQITSWLEDWRVNVGPTAPLPINVIAPALSVAGPVPQFTQEIRGLQARMLGVNDG